MKKKPAAQSGIFNLRMITACAFFFAASLLTYFSFTALASPPPTITVNSTLPVINPNDGFCTLPEAIISANTGMPSGPIAGECPAGGGPSGSTIIVLAIGATYTQVTAHNASYGFNGLPQITSTITIEGNGAIIQNGSATSTIICDGICANNFRLLYISPAGNLTLRNLTVSGGLAKGGDSGGGTAGGGGLGAGGAIYNQGRLTLSGVTLSGNTARGGDAGTTTISFGGGGGGMGGNGGDTVGVFTGGGGGGGMGGNGGASIDAPGGGGGGGANLTDVGQPGAGPLGGAGGGTTGGKGGDGFPVGNVTTSVGQPGLFGGGGGGGGNVNPGSGGGAGGGGGGGGGTVTAGTLAGAGGFGGGGGGGGSGTAGAGGFGGGGGLTFGANTAGGFGGGDNGGGGAGMGGAIFNDANATLTIFNSTLSGNSALGGAGGANSLGAGGNGGSGFGGAIFNLNGTVTINFSTIASNTVTAGAGGTSGFGNGLAGTSVADGVYNHQSAGLTATMSMMNTVLAGTGVDNCANDGGASFASSGYNVVQTAGATCGFAAVGDLTGVDPMLAALASNGGPTQTQALLTGSQAIDRIPNGVSGCKQGATYDQRGAPRAGGGAGTGGIACDTGAYEFNSTPTLPLLSVVSRKTHTGVGDFDIDLPLAGTRGVECRSGGPTSNYTMVFTFANPVTNCGTASTGVVSNGPNPNQCTVTLTGVSNAQYTTVTLTGAADSTGATGNVSGTMGVLLGDTSADGVVNSADITQTRRQSGNVTNSSNFREDVTEDGVINSADITLVRRQSGNALPTPP